MLVHNIDTDQLLFSHCYIRHVNLDPAKTGFKKL